MSWVSDRFFVIMNRAETERFLSFIPNMLPPEISLTKISRTSMLKMKKSNGYFRNNDYSSSTKSGQKHRASVPPEAYYRHYISLYYNFFSKTHLSKEEFKIFISRAMNVPKILRTMGGEYSDLENGVFEFIRLHKCGNRNCDGFATRKCSLCKNVRYCDADCQEMDFPKHSKLCRSLKHDKDRTFFVGWIIQEELLKRNENQSKLVPFESFLSILFSKIFLLFSDLLVEEDYPKSRAFIKEEIRKRCQTEGNIDLENLRNLRNENMAAVTVETLLLQIGLAWDKDEENLLSKLHNLVKKEQEAINDDLLRSDPTPEPSCLKKLEKKIIFVLDLVAWPTLVMWLLFLYRPADVDWIPGIEKFWLVTFTQIFLKSNSKRDFLLFVVSHYTLYKHLITWVWLYYPTLGWASCIFYIVLTIIFLI